MTTTRLASTRPWTVVTSRGDDRSDDAEPGRQRSATGGREQEVRPPTGQHRHLRGERGRVHQRGFLEAWGDARGHGDVVAVDDELEGAGPEILLEPHPAGDRGERVRLVVPLQLRADAVGEAGDE